MSKRNVQSETLKLTNKMDKTVSKQTISIVDEPKKIHLVSNKIATNI